MCSPKNSSKIVHPESAFVPATASPEQTKSAITGFRWDSAPEHAPTWHHHSRGQLKWSPSGPNRVHTTEGVWVTPALGAVWIPPEIMHHSYTDREHSLFLEAEVGSGLPAGCCIVLMTPELLKAMTSALDAIEAKSSTVSFVPALVKGIVDSGLRSIEDPIPMSAATISALLAAHHKTNLGSSIAEWAQLSELTEVKMAALLKEETGMTFPHWRRQLRLLQGLTLLATGRTVKQVAAQVGYSSTSHFTALFMDCLGTTPSRYFKPLRPQRKGAPQNASNRTSTHEAEVSNQKLVQQSLLNSSNVTAHLRIRNAPYLAEVVAVGIYDLPMGTRARLNRYSTAKLHWPVGAQTVATQAGTWVGHPQLAIWVPVGCNHESQYWGRQYCYLIHSSPATSHLPKHPCAVRVTDKLRQAMLDLIPSLKPCSREDAARIFLEEVKDSKIAPLPLRLIRAERLAPMVQALQVDPSQSRSMAEWAVELNMSRSSLARAFETELGMTFGHFQRLIRIRRATELLALGESVKAAASQVGYAGVAKFITMFRGVVGATPLRYFHQSRSLRD